MGKSRRNRSGGHRANPIARAPKPLTDPELAALREARVLPVLQDLQSLEPKRRSAAAAAVANIVQDVKCRKLLLREGIVHLILSETLTDANIDSRAAGWEVLRLLAEEEKADFSVHLYRSDVLTAIEHSAKAVVETLSSSSPPFETLQRAKQTVVWEITTCLVSLLAALASARAEILDAIAISQVVPKFLSGLIQTDFVPSKVLSESLSCLLIMCEDNVRVSQTVTSDQQLYQALFSFASRNDLRGVLACAVLHNVFSSLQWHDQSPGQDGASDATLIPSLTKVLESAEFGKSNVANQPSPTRAEDVETALETLASIGTDLQLALEKGNKADMSRLTEDWNGIDDTENGDAMNVDREDTEDDENAEAEEDEIEDDADEEGLGISEIEQDMECVTGVDNRDDTQATAGLEQLPTLRELIKRAIPAIIPLAQVADSEEMIEIQAHAISALSNTAWSVSCLEFSNGENAGILQAWAPAAKRIWTQVIAPILVANDASLGLASMVTSLAWAVSRVLGGNTPLVGFEHHSFLKLYRTAAAHAKMEEEGVDAKDPLQSLTVKCIGVLGQLAREPAPTERNREIGLFLFTVLSSTDTSVADAVEALNQMFDIYGDERFAYDKEVFWKNNFLTHLEEIRPAAKKMAKTINPKQFAELRMRADEAVLNLGRFVQYKKKHAPR